MLAITWLTNKLYQCHVSVSLLKTAVIWLQEPLLSYQSQVRNWKLSTVSYFCCMNNNLMSVGLPSQLGVWTLNKLNRPNRSWKKITSVWSLGMNVSGQNKGWSLANDQTKTSRDWFSFFTADHSHSESFVKAYNVSLFYKIKYILSQNSHYMSTFNTCWKENFSKTMG